jgi:2-amino-4-hydroxy-6-hydroxymethyldihydropteridine diphosphokinase
MNVNIFLLLGTNMGNKRLNLIRATESLCTIGKIARKSSVYSTDPWGNNDQPLFYNQVVEIHTDLGPETLLEKVLAIETQLGRRREEKWGPRLIDIDLLFYQEQIIETATLSIPHPGIPFRRFVLEPLAELAPFFIHPSLQKNISTLLNECTDPLGVKKVVE